MWGSTRWPRHGDCAVHGPLSPDDVVSKHFRPQQVLKGYDPDEVDDFLDHVARAMAGFAPPISAMDVREHEFTGQRWRGSYNAEEVDDFLECIARTFEGRAGYRA